MTAFWTAVEDPSRSMPEFSSASISEENCRYRSRYEVEFTVIFPFVVPLVSRFDHSETRVNQGAFQPWPVSSRRFGTEMPHASRKRLPSRGTVQRPGEAALLEEPR